MFGTMTLWNIHLLPFHHHSCTAVGEGWGAMADARSTCIQGGYHAQVQKKKKMEKWFCFVFCVCFFKEKHNYNVDHV